MRFLIVILYVVCCTVGVSASEDAPLSQLVLAHYMPCWRPTGSSPGDTYWYGDRVNPANSPAKSGDNNARPAQSGRSGDPLQPFIDEILLAKRYGIDGFLIDELDDSITYRQCYLNVLHAAEKVGGFKVGLMPDFCTIWYDKGGDFGPQSWRDKIHNWVVLAKDSPACLRYQGKPVVMGYALGAPDAKGMGEMIKGNLVDWMAAKGLPIAYAPTHGVGWPVYTKPYANDPVTGYQNYSFMAGSFSPGSPNNEHDRALAYWPATLPIMGEASFTYYNRGWCYVAPRLTELYRRNWDWAIAHRERVRWMQIITWNDWGESAIAPSDHHFSAFMPLTRYYADWFHSGKQPVITADAISIFHRPAPYDAEPTVYPARVNSGRPTDEIEALAWLTAPATVVIESGGTVTRHEVEAGLHSVIVPFAVGIQRAHLERGGNVIATVETPVPIVARSVREDLWFIAGDSRFPPRPVITTWASVEGAWSGTDATRAGHGLLLAGDEHMAIDSRLAATFAPSTEPAGLAVRVRGGAGSYRALIHRDGDSLAWRVERRDGDKSTALAEGRIPAIATVHVRLDAVSERILLRLEDKLVADVSDWTYAYGRVGLVATAQTAFTDILWDSWNPEASPVQAQMVADSAVMLGGAGSITITATNTGTAAVPTKMSVQLPDGWKAVPAELTLDLAAGAQVITTLQLTPPAVVATGPAVIEARLSTVGTYLDTAKSEFVIPGAVTVVPQAPTVFTPAAQPLIIELANPGDEPVTGSVRLAITGPRTLAVLQRTCGPIPAKQSVRIEFTVPDLELLGKSWKATWTVLTPGRSTTVVQDLSLKAWQVLGPFAKEFDTEFGPEKQLGQKPVDQKPADQKPADLKPVDLKAVYKDQTGKACSWHQGMMEPNGYLNLVSQFALHENCCAYAVAWVRSTEARTAQLSFGSDDGCKVWMNGKQVHSENGSHGANPGQFTSEVDLKAGWNEVLFKVIQGGGGWGMYCDITKQDGTPMTNLTWSPIKP